MGRYAESLKNGEEAPCRMTWGVFINKANDLRLYTEVVGL